MRSGIQSVLNRTQPRLLTLTLMGAAVLQSLPADAATTLACQNYTSSAFLCVHTAMPLMSQGDTSNGQVLVNGKWVKEYPSNRSNYSAMINKSTVGFTNYTMGLLEYINVQLSKAAGKSYTEYVSWDPGWCGGTSAAVNLRTYASEAGNTKTVDGLNLAGTDVNAFIYQSFKVVQTNVQTGGTFLSYMTSGFNTVTGKATTVEPLPNQTNYAKTMPLQSMAVCSSVSGAGCHFVSLYGMEGTNYVVSDPWGSIYTVSYNTTSLNLTFVGWQTDGVYGGYIPHYGKVAKDWGAAQISGYTTVKAPPTTTTTTVAALAAPIAKMVTCRSCELP